MTRHALLIPSIALLVAVIFLMIRGRTWIDCIEYCTDHSYTFVCSDAGRFIVGTAEVPWYGERGAGLRSIHRDRPHAHQPWRSVIPVEVARRISADAGLGSPSVYSVYGGWMVAAGSLPIVVAWIRPRRRCSSDGCSACGYSLTGNASGVCPECGTPTTAGVKA